MIFSLEMSAMKSDVKENRVAAAANQPHHHRDVDLLILWSANDEFGNRDVG
jgi:hypothetical protein